MNDNEGKTTLQGNVMIEVKKDGMWVVATLCSSHGTSELCRILGSMVLTEKASDLLNRLLIDGISHAIEQVGGTGVKAAFFKMDLPKQ